MLQESRFADLELVSGGEKLKVHRAVVSAASDHLKALLESSPNQSSVPFISNYALNM